MIIEQILTRYRYKSILDVVRGIAAEEGVLGFWRGIGVKLLYKAPAGAVSFGCYELFRRLVLVGAHTLVDAGSVHACAHIDLDLDLVAEPADADERELHEAVGGQPGAAAGAGHGCAHCGHGVPHAL